MSRRRDRKRKKGKGSKGSRRPKAAKIEWIGGLVQMPFTIEPDDGGASYEPLMAMWVERPLGIVIATELLEPGPTQGRLGAALEGALAGDGLARNATAPTRIRVATQELAAEVRETIGPGTPIIVAPTPELDAVISEMVQPLGGPPTTLFPSPAVTPELVERFFVAARALWVSAPWRFAEDGQIIRVDAPSIGVDGACLSIMGAAGQQFGIALFESIEHYDAFIRVASTRPDRKRGIDLGGEELLLSFDHEGDVPQMMVAQARKLGLATAGKKAFPTLHRVRRDASFGPPSAEDYALMTAVAAAVGSFTLMHRELFEEEQGIPACQTFEHDGAPAVTLTAPYDVMLGELDPEGGTASSLEALGALGAPSPPRGADAPTRKIGRNEPCPCGSGKKYKRCCIDQARRAEGPPASVHEIERAMIADMMSYGVDRFGQGVFEDCEDWLEEAGMALAGPWMLYVLDLDGATLAEHFAADVRLSKRERAMLEAQREAWLSVWEVVDVEPGRSISLRDLLTGEQRKVREVMASKIVRKRVGLLARVVDFEGDSVLDGVHVRSLPPRETAEVVERARKRLRRKSAIPIERLRNEKMATYLVRRWEEVADDFDLRRAIPPKLHNTEGHELVLVSDHFRYERRAHDWLLERLERLEDIVLERLSADEAEMTFYMAGNPKIPSWDNTIIGKATASDGVLRVECNSRERADALRERVREVAGDIVTERGRTFQDPMSDPNLAAAAARRAASAAEGEEEPPPEVRAALAEHKAKYFASWLDQPVPALGGETPREHVRTAEGRRAVELLLKDVEFMEQRDPGTAFDVDVLRRELGLDG